MAAPSRTFGKEYIDSVYDAIYNTHKTYTKEMASAVGIELEKHNIIYKEQYKGHKLLAKAFNIPEGKNLKETKENFFKKYCPYMGTIKGMSVVSCDEMIKNIKIGHSIVGIMEETVTEILKGIDAVNANMKSIKSKYEKIPELELRLLCMVNLETSGKLHKERLKDQKLLFDIQKEYLLMEQNEYISVLRKLLRYKTKGNVENANTNESSYFGNIF